MSAFMRQFEVARVLSPQKAEQDPDNHGKHFDAEIFGLAVYLDKAVEECRQPQKPLEECSEHDAANNGDVHNLHNVSAHAWPGQLGICDIRLAWAIWSRWTAMYFHLGVQKDRCQSWRWS